MENVRGKPLRIQKAVRANCEIIDTRCYKHHKIIIDFTLPVEVVTHRYKSAPLTH